MENLRWLGPHRARVSLLRPASRNQILWNANAALGSVLCLQPDRPATLAISRSCICKTFTALAAGSSRASSPPTDARLLRLVKQGSDYLAGAGWGHCELEAYALRRVPEEWYCLIR